MDSLGELCQSFGELPTNSRPLCLTMSANDVVDLSTTDNGEASGSDGGPSEKIKPEVRSLFGDRPPLACVISRLLLGRVGRVDYVGEAGGVNANPV